MKSEFESDKERTAGKIIALTLAALLPLGALFFGISLYIPHRDMLQRATVVVTLGALAGLIRWFVIRVKTNHAKRSDVIIFILMTLYLLYVGYCQITLPHCTECDKPTFLNAWVWKVIQYKLI